MNQIKLEDSLVPKYTEFETKYRVEPELLIEFKSIVEKLSNTKDFLYIEGKDEYYTKENSFARYRKPSFGLDNNRSEVTWKRKPDGAKNNIIRREINWRVDSTDPDTIRAGIMDEGYEFNFSIWKSCHIYRLDDATLVFYTVYDTTDGKPSKTDTFVEIELLEETVHNLTENQAWEVIEKYEKVLEPIEISPQKRLRRSLFEMYKRDSK